MTNFLISEAIGDIAGSVYERRTHRVKDYDKVKMFSSRAPDTVVYQALKIFPGWMMDVSERLDEI